MKGLSLKKLHFALKDQLSSLEQTWELVQLLNWLKF